MGEARLKRRRQVEMDEGVTVHVPDLITNQPKPLRLSPPVEQVLRRWVEFVDRWQRGERDISTRVPCAGCTACCRGGDLIEIDEFDSASLPFLQLTPPNAAGERYLQRRPDGSCVHLGPAGCEVYERRPMACRGYDCRLFSAFGITPRSDPEYPFPQWAPAADTREDRTLNNIAWLLGMAAVRKANQSGEAWSAGTLLPRLMAQYFELRPACLELLTVISPAEWTRLAKALGVNETALFDGFRQLAVDAGSQGRS